MYSVLSQVTVYSRSQVHVPSPLRPLPRAGGESSIKRAKGGEDEAQEKQSHRKKKKSKKEKEEQEEEQEEEEQEKEEEEEIIRRRRCPAHLRKVGGSPYGQHAVLSR